MSVALETEHWAYQYGRPVSTGLFKFQADDFQVTEELGYSPTGDGEHQFIYIEKTNINTAFVAEQLAKFCKLPLRQISYAGRKDKYAVTRQWFGIHTPGAPDIDFSDFALEGVKVLSQTRHNKKLRTGQLQGNHFTITLRQVSNPEAIEARLATIASEGVPNYYGEQRFGVMRINEQGEVKRGGNLALAQRMIDGETIRHRNKRSMALSALRSWLFNEVISHRLEAGAYHQVMNGDALTLSGSKSYFVHQGDTTEVQARYKEKDVCPSAPLWGKGGNIVEAEAQMLEQTVLGQSEAVTTFLEQSGFEHERRPIKIWPQQLEWLLKGDTLTVSFFLPSGCFATSVLRECIETIAPTNSI
ncbi:tRNA pseudouridine(13) synthase TruD [Alteromonas halophila]|uniref:tRNA pseudouridine synthase D n=1 Tax=Alteromonas halophila TaxID=516698 RepID=A0A918MXR2_9ALTE|nr:tRNA pseudouridine(13) synthase TruD [Alteromonas halophila]GGW79915.1 tRNA pseudouridine synthase D [Alteromonas halophila]